MSIVTRAEVIAITGISTSYNDRIDTNIPIAENHISRICNNKFKNPAVQQIDNSIVFVNSTRTISSDESFADDGFAASRDIVVEGSVLNDGFYELDSVTTTSMVVDALYSLTDEDYSSADDADAPTITITIVDWPLSFKEVVAHMIAWNILYRGKRTGVTSESIGSYSVSFDSSKIGSYGYPADIIGLLTTGMIPRFL